MDMPGRGLYDERDSGIARSGKLMRLRSKAQIDLHLIQLSISLIMHPDFDLGSVKDSFFFFYGQAYISIAEVFLQWRGEKSGRCSV